MKAILISILLLSSTYCFGQYETRLVAPDSSADDRFGVLVATYGAFSVVGALLQDSDTVTSGAAYVYEYIDSIWIFKQKIQPAGHPLWSWYGSVALFDTTLMVGAFGAPFGRVYVYSYDGSTWKQKQILIPSDKDSTNFFGEYISIWGNNAVVSARGNSYNGIDTGASYFFRYNGTQWIESGKVYASSNSPSDHFGWANDISDSVAVIGAWGDSNAVNGRAGAYYVFKNISNSWVEEQKVLANDGNDNDGFGKSVSIHGNDIIAGSSYDDVIGTAYYFINTDSITIQEQKFNASNPQNSARFGFWNRIWDRYVAVGAYGDHQSATSGGAVYVLIKADTSWEHHLKLVASDAENEDQLGRHLDICGNTIIAGAVNSPNVLRHGKAYIFELCGLPVITPYSDLKLCQGDTITLKAGCPSDSVNWHNASGSLLTHSRLIDYQPSTTEIIIAEVYSADTLSGRDTIELEVFPYPIADFTADTVCEGSPTSFTDLSTTIPGSNYWWDFDANGVEDDNVVGSTSFTYPVAGTYTAKLKITNEAGCRDIITKQVIVEVCTGIEPIEKSVEFEIYPNPTNGSFEIRLESERPLGEVQIDIFNAFGRKVYSSPIEVGTRHTESIALDSADGLYLVTVTGDNLNATRKLVRY